MNPNNPDSDGLNNLLSFLKNKRKRSETLVLSSDDVMFDIKLICIDRMIEDLKNKKLNSKDLHNYMCDLEFTLEGIKNILEENTKDKSAGKSSLIAMITVHIQLVKEIKAGNSEKGFNVIKFLNGEKEKTLKQNKDKKKKHEVYESESEDESSSDEDDKPKRKKSKKVPKVEENDDGDDDGNDDGDDGDNDDGDDGDNDDGDGDDEDDEDYDKKMNKKLLNNKMCKEFLEQMYRGKNQDMEDESIKYFSNLPNKDRKIALQKLKDINDYQNKDKPILFQIMGLDLPVAQKNHILKNYITVSTSRFEQNKLKQWVDSVMNIPFGVYKGTNLDSIKPEKVGEFIDKLQRCMDNAAYGHDEAKRQIIQVMGQLIRNPKSKGNILGIYGPPGNGKTSLIKEGIAKAMDKPFIFISLGGATDSSFLEGHSYTYEGSIYGRIANGLITSKAMDPIIYFDELDKISKTPKGDEIINILVHLTDPTQNSHFRDKYFHGIDIDLSKATMIFSFNDPSNINPILLDRITMVETKYLLTSQKIHIAKNYLLPEMFKDIGLTENAVVINDDIIRSIINKYTHEGGVRKLKSILYAIIREINLANLINSKIDDRNITFPFTLKQENIKSLLKHKTEIEPDKINKMPKCGIVNGLYAGSLGIGGVLPIEIVWIPSSKPLELKATGHLEKVIKESTEVACSLAWNYLEDSVKDKFLNFWKNKPMGFHIHCPEGAVPKDGPSAGAALSVALYSLLTNRKIRNNIAMTGEINLQGKVMAIGGLEEKLEGAKRAGVNIALIPKENEKNLAKIRERNVSLFDDTFKIEIIETFDDVIKHALLPYSTKDTPMVKGFFGDPSTIEPLDLEKS